MNKKYIFLLFGLLFFSCKKQGGACESCSLQPESGPCEALFTRYYFDDATKSCKEFTWGGCEGVVPFETKADCEACNCQ